MPGRQHSRATKLAATFLARQTGVDAAADAFGLDPRTVKRWMETVEVAADSWTAIRDVLQARAGEMAARGETRGLVPMLTGAGIAERNVRYAMLIARREARNGAEDPDPADERPAWLVAVHALRDDQKRLFADLLREELERRADAAYQSSTPAQEAGESPISNEADHMAQMMEFIARIAAMTKEAVADALSELKERRTQRNALTVQPPGQPEPSPWAAETAQEPPRLPKEYHDAPDAWRRIL